MNNSKFCAYCSKELIKREDERLKDFDKRTTCGRICSNKVVPRRKLEGCCKYCKKAISASRSYCSRECMKKADPWGKQWANHKKAKPKDLVLKHMRKLKQKAISYKGGKCLDCGYDKSAWALCFHHLDPKEKEFTINGRSISWERLKLELDKCVLLCLNCHAERHEELHKIKEQQDSKEYEVRRTGIEPVSTD